MITREERVKKVADFGNKYVEFFLKTGIAEYCSPGKSWRDQKEELREDWYAALKFFFNKGFNRGRRDSLSIRFRNNALLVIDSLKPLLTPGFDGYKDLEQRLAENGVNNHIDRSMVSDAIRMCLTGDNSSPRNLVNLALDNIQNKSTKIYFDELDRLAGIGDKLASFFLRDVVLAFEMEESLDDRDARYCQPVDTWVEQVVRKLEIATLTRHAEEELCEETNGSASQGKKRQLSRKYIEEIKVIIIEQSKQAEVSSLLFNAGAWMVGAHPFELLFELF